MVVEVAKKVVNVVVVSWEGGGGYCVGKQEGAMMGLKKMRYGSGRAVEVGKGSVAVVVTGGAVG